MCKIMLIKLRRIKSAQLQDVVVWAIFSTKCYVNIRVCPIMKVNITTNILMYIHGCNAKFYNKFFVSYCKNKNVWTR